MDDASTKHDDLLAELERLRMRVEECRKDEWARENIRIAITNDLYTITSSLTLTAHLIRDHPEFREKGIHRLDMQVERLREVIENCIALL